MIEKHDTYWQNKIAAFLNESPIKVFDIARRDEIAKAIRESFSGLRLSADEKLIATADHIASGLTRAVLPFDDSKLTAITVKHPLVKEQPISFPIGGIDVDSLKNEIKTLLEKDLEYLTKETATEERARQIFNYLFFAFSKRLRNENIGKLGALWNILPADTRLPDHPMWHHFGLTSAVYSSLEADGADADEGAKENLSLVVYSITPVQEFIGKARKLRDYWTGSVLLSYLAFVGIAKLCDEIGPDHILYPSLHNQSLMEQWLSLKDRTLKGYLDESDETLKTLQKDSKGIASFPNKFVFLCNNAHVEDLCRLIGETVDNEWKRTADIVREYIAQKAGAAASDVYDDIWQRTVDRYWKYSLAATGLATIKNEADLKRLLPEAKWKDEHETMLTFDKAARTNDANLTQYDVSNLYGTSHSLVQGLLAAGKTKPVIENVRHSQNGEKCPLCGENEVLHTFRTVNGVKAKDYSENVRAFWDILRKKENADGDNFTQVGEHERLCAVCATKRFLPVALKDKSHLLYQTLVEAYQGDSFPSTTEMSAYEYLQDVPQEKRKKIAENLHGHEFDTNDDSLKKLLENAKNFETKYYAFLLMDGDKMGDLINGESIEAAWSDVLNIADSTKTPFADRNFARRRRTINPALHAMISDSLNNFARYGVQPLVNASGGRLIYAGGDDVCAILPLSAAFETADKIRKVYQLSYGEVTENGSQKLDEPPKADMLKIVMHLGHSENQDDTKISLSGAIIIAHHKQPLKEVIQDAHKVLEGVAKVKSGRNSLAIRLKKRSGGARDMWFKWEEKNLFASDEKTLKQSFEEIIKVAQKKELSTSLLYRIESLKGSIEPLVCDVKEKKNRDLIVKLFEYEVCHSGFGDDGNAARKNTKNLSDCVTEIEDKRKTAHEIAKNLSGLCVKVERNKDGVIMPAKDWYNPEAAVIANFMAQKKRAGGNGNGKD